MKGIILAGGTGSRLWPLTIPTSKQLLPIFDKPMIYYPLATLMESGIREISLITTPQDQAHFQNLLGTGSEFGIEITYVSQPKPDGLAQAFLLCESQIADSKCALVLGDNLFDVSFNETANHFEKFGSGAQIFAYKVQNPNDYGVVEFNSENKVIRIVEKPMEYISSYAVPGIYFYDETVVERAKELVPSPRGELEISDLHSSYLLSGDLKVARMQDGAVWLDTGSFESMNDASQYVRIIEERKGHKIGCIEEIAWKSGWIDNQKITNLAQKYNKNSYGKYLENLLQ